MVLLLHNNLFASEAFTVIGKLFTLLYSPWDPYKLCWKKKNENVFLLKIFYFSISLTSNKLYWIEDQLANVSTWFYMLASWRWWVKPLATWLDTGVVD